MKKYRDKFFRFYFNNPERLMSLCNALTGEDATNPDEVEINTIEETFFSNAKNDISCLFRGRLLIMIEQQSTINQNMPLRFLLYLVKLWNKIYDKEFSADLHKVQQIKLYRPEFYVFYNGLRDAPEFLEMKLSDNFIEPTDSLELKVKFYNLKADKNLALKKKSLPLEDYCVIVDRTTKNILGGMDQKSAFYEAFNYCLANREWMAEFLKIHEWELYDMISTEYREDIFFDSLREEGRTEGVQEGKFEMVKNFLKAQTPLKYIVAATGWSEEKILSIAEKIK